MTSGRLRALVCAAAATFVLLSSMNLRGSARERDTLVLAQQREPISLNPLFESGSAGAEFGSLLFTYLVTYDAQNRMIGDAASVVPTVENGGIARDGLTVTYHVRRGLHFADGAPLTSRDCAFSIAKVLDPHVNAQSRIGYDDIARVETPDETTLVLHLKHAYAPLVAIVMAPDGYPILPQHLLAHETDLNHAAFNAKPIGAGPFVVDTWARGDHLSVHANPFYWRGTPRISHITIRFIPQPETAIQQLHTGEVDGYILGRNADAALAARVPGVRVETFRLTGANSLVFNTEDPLVHDPRVRHALAEAVDFATIVPSATLGTTQFAGAGRALFGWAYDPRAFPDVPYNPVHARALLDAAGWRTAANGMRMKDRVPLAPLLILNTPASGVLANAIVQAERAIGVEVTLKAFNLTQFYAPASQGGPVYGGKFTLALYPFTDAYDPDTTDQFACANVPPHGFNKPRICDAQIDALERAGAATSAAAPRRAVYERLQRRLYDLLPMVPLVQLQAVDAMTARVRTVPPSVAGPFWNVGAWSLAAGP